MHKTITKLTLWFARNPQSRRPLDEYFGLFPYQLKSFHPQLACSTTTAGLLNKFPHMCRGGQGLRPRRFHENQHPDVWRVDFELRMSTAMNKNEMAQVIINYGIATLY